MRNRQQALGRVAAGLVLAGTLAAATGAATPARALHDARPPGVAWFGGSLPEAFAAAADQRKPVFLYWSAVWCPPCQELKATIFQRRDFLDRLSLFVPVYVDGDAAGAQVIGDQFHVSGYPTVVILRADRAELERVSGGMDLARYAEVLDAALAQARPARDLLAALHADGAGAALAAGDCRQLAYNGWQLDDAWMLRPQSLGPLALDLERAAARCPAALRVERARLQLAAVAAASAAAPDAAGGTPVPEPLRTLAPRVGPLLSDRQLALAVGDALVHLPAAYFHAAVALDPASRPVLRARWFALMDALARDGRYSAADRIDALRSKLVAARALDPGGRIPAPLGRQVRQHIDAALAREHEPYARASVVNSALNALYELDDEARAAAVLYGEIRTAAHPYYYMADMAELEEKRGHREAAIDWFARSYREAQGPATRFQWGVGYVRGLVRLAPQDDAAIRDASLAVLGDLAASGDLHGRTRRSLDRLDAGLRDWNRDGMHADAVAAVRTRMQGICAQLPATDTARSGCSGFLAGG